MSNIHLKQSSKEVFKHEFSGLMSDLIGEQITPFKNPSTRRRSMNVLRTYQQSECINTLAIDFFERHILQTGKKFTRSFKNFTTYLARYEQQKSGEPGVIKIKYPNDLLEQLRKSIKNDEKLTCLLNDYFASLEHEISDPDIIRVFEYAALDTAMVMNGLIDDNPQRRNPFHGDLSLNPNKYFQIASDNIELIATDLQNNLSWEKIFNYQESRNWEIVKFFLDREKTFKLTYPGRYAKLLEYLIHKFKENGLISDEKKRVLIIGAGEAPEMEVLAEILGLENIEDIFATDLIPPEIPFPMVKAIDDGVKQADPKKMIMDPIDFLSRNNFSKYIGGLDITDLSTIPANIAEIGISLMMGVLVHIDGPTDPQKVAYKQAIINWVKTGKTGALFIANYISKAFLPIPGMVLRKIDCCSDTGKFTEHPILGKIFTQQLADGRPVWDPKEIKDLHAEIIFPGPDEINELETIPIGHSWLGQFMKDDLRRPI